MGIRMDWRVWLPALVAIACFSTRALPKTAATNNEKTRSITLPQLYGMPLKNRLRRFRLDAEESSARFDIKGRQQHMVAQCQQLDGELLLGPKPDQGTLTLRLDLSSMRSLSKDNSDFSIPDVLGVLGNLEVVYHGKMISVATNDLPGVVQTTWLGRIQLGSRVLAQPMQLWRCALPGQAIRLQGHGIAVANSLGLPSRYTLSLLDEKYAITLGLDLAWKPVRD
jgi:hypothetical protein